VSRWPPTTTWRAWLGPALHRWVGFPHQPNEKGINTTPFVDKIHTRLCKLHIGHDHPTPTPFSHVREKVGGSLHPHIISPIRQWNPCRIILINHWINCCNSSTMLLTNINMGQDHPPPPSSPLPLRTWVGHLTQARCQ
jgi:hypothetical protein